MVAVVLPPRIPAFDAGDPGVTWATSTPWLDGDVERAGEGGVSGTPSIPR